MQAIILAAGMGSRLKKYTANNTKCMVEVAGKKLIDWTLESIADASIDHIIVVIGYKGKELKDYLTEKYSGTELRIDFVENKDYATTNNIYSLYLAREYLEADDTILFESDIIFEKDLVKKLIDYPYENVATIAKYRNWMDGTVVTCKGSIITEFIEKKYIDYNNLDKYCKTVNIYKFSKDFCKEIYMDRLGQSMAENGYSSYYEDVLKNIVKVSEATIYGYEIGDMNWYEIDDAQDLDIANALFTTGEERYKLIMSKFGGYWRYDNINDYCYLVNPYFPTRKMIEKMKSEYEDLLGSYPSSLNVQNMDASRIFGVDEDKILVGNGASELINVLGYILKGTMTVPVPTFNEYIRCFSNCKIRALNNKLCDFAPSVETYLEAVRDTDIMCIVNPDNPSGFMFTKEQILTIAEECRKCGTTLIVDESFVDFAYPDDKYTLLDDDILERYPNMIVIRSIGKTYGVAGLRLGVMASGDMDLLKNIRDRMPIWNINSFAEYYLQIYNVFAKDYGRSCEIIASERARMIDILSKNEELIVYPSQANYIMIKFRTLRSRDICVKLLDGGVLLKDLSTKDYFDGDNYIRVAVKSISDNNTFIRTLSKVIQEEKTL